MATSSPTWTVSNPKMCVLQEVDYPRPYPEPRKSCFNITLPFLFKTKILFSFLNSLMRATGITHLTLLVVITLTKFGENYKL